MIDPRTRPMSDFEPLLVSYRTSFFIRFIPFLAKSQPGCMNFRSAPPLKDGPVTAMFQLAPTESGCLPEPGVFGHSFGSGGMSVALADASVRNIAPTMSPMTFGRALCPADGNPPGGDWDED